MVLGASSSLGVHIAVSFWSWQWELKSVILIECNWYVRSCSQYFRRLKPVTSQLHLTYESDVWNYDGSSHYTWQHFLTRQDTNGRYSKLALTSMQSSQLNAASDDNFTSKYSCRSVCRLKRLQTVVAYRLSGSRCNAFTKSTELAQSPAVCFQS